MTKVKICGITTSEAMQAAVDAGADYVGFVFATSKRQVTPKKARTLAQWVSPEVQKVGVFVNPSINEVQEVLKDVRLDLIQIHGDYDEALKTLDIPIISAVAVGKEQLIVRESADYYLFDAPIAGSGKTFDWEMLDRTNMTKPYFIAGGLTLENVSDCIAHFHPYAVDVSSGVETNGKKDVEKIKAFIKGVKYDL
ncbi:phosphoribosylanthranilate isomerase [Streptococcus sciuri]|uniref:N-(5'-phosphoribosyl)anthranilate isomerase n=1 Tax=Streptococcus sciuri TaxID=2973939 RepID=A0ABT2F4K9_9STRE|nr:phosphoribosylanthranilate isomerase [Streptococcus sciuri]MCS4487411.1 phosphoribosylanthranilate isomerase [Streptococcus sciuri]